MGREITEDDELMDWYMAGFNDKLDDMYMLGMFFNTPMEQRAYELGGAHALAGDDVKSIDLLTREEILNEIKNENG